MYDGVCCVMKITCSTRQMLVGEGTRKTYCALYPLLVILIPLQPESGPGSLSNLSVPVGVD